MEMLEKILFTYVLGFGLQSFAVVFAIFTFNQYRVVYKKYFLTAIILTVISGLVRLLPISIGVHTIINMLFLYIICVIFIKMPAYKTIMSTILCFTFILVCEMSVSIILTVIKGKAYVERLMSGSTSRAILGDMANLMFVLIVAIIYYVLKKKGENHRSISV